MLTEQQQKFLELVKQIESLQEQIKPLSEELDTVLSQLTVGELFQDPETKLVYRAAKQDGVWVKYKPLIYQRTRKIGESKGSISVKEAKEAGFILTEEN